MQALDRIPLTNNWITFVFLLGFVLLLAMKLLQPQRLLGYSGAFFIQGFIQKRAEKKVEFFTPFHLFLFVFSVLIIGLACYFVASKTFIEKTFLNFLATIFIVLIYLSIKFFINFIIVKTLHVEEKTRYFFTSTVGYLYTACLLIFPVLIVYQYGFKNIYFLYFFIAIALLFRFILILFNNKKLIFSQLFYFILYFCTLELAPLLILYKTTTT